MNLDNIKQALQRLGALVEDCENRGVSDMERDLILKELRELYTAVRFGGGHPAPEPEPLQPSVPAPAPEVEKVSEDAAVVEVKETPAEPAPVEPAPAAEAEQTEETVAEETAAPAEEQKSEQSQDAEMLSLFSTDEIKVSRRRRMIVRSLYGDDAAPAAEETSAPAPAEPAAEETSAPAPAEPAAESVSESVEVPETASEPVEAAELEDDITILDIDDTISIFSDIDISPTPIEEPAPEPEPEAVHEYAPASEKKPEPQILGDTINSGVQTIGDTIRPHENAVVEAVANGHIDSLAEAIGINDRFLLIRDLFNGNTAEYERAITRLDSFADENDCMIHIIETYDWNPYSEGAKLLMSLIERRYGSRA